MFRTGGSAATVLANMKKLIKRLKDFIYKKYIEKHEKKYNHLKYCFFSSDCSKALIVIFSGFPGRGSIPKYNYMKTLRRVKSNKLFLLDDI